MRECFGCWVKALDRLAGHAQWKRQAKANGLKLRELLCTMDEFMLDPHVT